MASPTRYWCKDHFTNRNELTRTLKIEYTDHSVRSSNEKPRKAVRHDPFGER